MNNDDRLSSGLNIDMCIEQMESKMSDDIIMQQIYISLCAYKIEIEKLQNENEELKLELSGYRSAILKNDNLLGLQKEIERLKEQKKEAIEWVKKHIETYQKNGIVILDWDTLSDPRNLLQILGGDE